MSSLTSYHPDCSFPSHPVFPLSTPLFLFSKGQATQVHEPNMVSQVTIRLGIPLILRRDEATRVGAKGSSKQAKESETAPAPCRESHKKIKLYNIYIA